MYTGHFERSTALAAPALVPQPSFASPGSPSWVLARLRFRERIAHYFQGAGQLWIGRGRILCSPFRDLLLPMPLHKRFALFLFHRHIVIGLDRPTTLLRGAFQNSRAEHDALLAVRQRDQRIDIT